MKVVAVMALEFITKYYGVDWVAMILAFTAVYLLGHRKRSGFLVGILASVCWCGFAYMAESLADIISNAVIMFLYYKGYRAWKKYEDANTNNVG